MGRDRRRSRSSTATGSPGPPSRSTTGSSAAPTARRPPGDGVRVRMLKDFAFHVVGTGEDARELDRGPRPGRARRRRAPPGSWRTVVAPPGEHRPLHAVGNELIEALLDGGPRRDRRGAGRPARPSTSRSSRTGAPRPGARTNHLCLDLYDLPQIPHRIAEELGGAARFVIREGECPFCRLVRDEVRRPERLVWEDADERGVRPVRLALAVRGLDRAAPPRGRLRRATAAPTSPPRPRRSARSSRGSRPASTGRPTTSSSTRRRCASRSTRRTTGTGRSTRACARSPVSSWEPDCRSTPSRRRTRSRSSSAVATRSGGATG